MDIGPRATESRVCVDYPAIRNEIQDGDILLFRGTSWLGRVIDRVRGRITGRVTRSPYSHAAIVGWWSGRLMVLEATPTGVVTSRMSLIVNQYSGQVELWTTDEQLSRFEVVRTAQLLLGKRYAKFTLLRTLKRWLLRRGHHAPIAPEAVPEVAPDAAPEDFVADEFVTRMWRAGGVDLGNHASDMVTGPCDIATSPRVRKVGDLVRGEPGKIVNDTVRRQRERVARARYVEKPPAPAAARPEVPDRPPATKQRAS